MLIERGVEVTVLAPRDWTVTPLLQLGCRYAELPLASQSTRPADDLRTLYALYIQYRALKPALVFHYTIKPNIYGSIAAWLAHVPSIAVTTGLGYVFIQPSRTARIAKALYRFAFRFPREIWFLNQDDFTTFANEHLLARPERGRLLHGEGINLEHFAFTPPPRADQFTFILIGRLLWDKGIGEYIEAARALRTRYPHARFQLLGPIGVANPSTIARSDIDAWTREGVIEYLGEAHDVRPFIAAASCVVLPSYREGIPRTLLEAAAMGRPIIASDVPGCREVVADGVTGLLCAARDSASLTAQLSQMLNLSAGARHTMGSCGRAKVAAEFDETHILNRYRQAIHTITGAPL